MKKQKLTSIDPKLKGLAKALLVHFGADKEKYRFNITELGYAANRNTSWASRLMEDGLDEATEKLELEECVNIYHYLLNQLNVNLANEKKIKENLETTWSEEICELEKNEQGNKKATKGGVETDFITDVKQLNTKLVNAGYTSDFRRNKFFDQLATKYHCYFLKTSHDDPNKPESGYFFNKGILTIQTDAEGNKISVVDFSLPYTDLKENIVITKTYRGSIVYEVETNNVFIRLFRYGVEEAPDISTIKFKINKTVAARGGAYDVAVGMCLTNSSRNSNIVPTVQNIILSTYELAKEEIEVILPLLKIRNEEFCIEDTNFKLIVEELKKLIKKADKNVDANEIIELMKKNTKTVYRFKESLFNAHTNIDELSSNPVMAEIISLLNANALNSHDYFRMENETRDYIRSYIVENHKSDPVPEQATMEQPHLSGS